MALIAIAILRPSSIKYGDSRNVIGNLNKISPDPAKGEMKRETKKLRDELNNLDKPKKIEKTPNQIKEESKSSSSDD